MAPKGVHNVGRLLEAGERADLPVAAHRPLRLLADQFFDTRDRIGALTKEIRREAESCEAAKRLQAIPGIGPISASALAATLPDVTGFRSSRDLSAWLGLTPKPHSSGGREKPGRISIPLVTLLRNALPVNGWETATCGGFSISERWG